jgi:Bifunctional DNA primase/polymerase, N-terminal/Primase C terminal 1 (PriCT-1)
MMKAALALASRGLAVFPCRERSKLPATEHGFLEATRAASAITEWWSLLPNANIGIATGPASGIFVLDIDSPEAETELHKVEAEFGLLPPTVEVITGKGRHCYFKYPGDHVLKNTQGRIAAGIDSRGAGGYVLAPPSIHPSGRRYEWSVDTDKEFADAPAWLIEKLAAGSNGHTPTPPDQWVEIAAEGISEGARNATLTRLAGYFLRRPNIDPLLILELLQGWNEGRCRPPLPSSDIERIVDSICGRELRRRGAS